MDPTRLLADRYRFSRRLPGRADRGIVTWQAIDQTDGVQVVASVVSSSRGATLQHAVGFTHDRLAALMAIIRRFTPDDLPEPPPRDRRCVVAVAEWIPGRSLHQRLKASPVSSATAVRWMTQVTSVVTAIHKHGAVHGGLSTRSILVQRADGGPVPVVTQLVMPPDGAFFSPERLEGKGATESDDTWALCAALYTSLTGHRPFSGTSASDLKDNIAHARMAPLTEFGIEDPDLQRIIDRGFTLDFDRRCTTARELLSDLTAWQTDHPPATEAAQEEELQESALGVYRAASIADLSMAHEPGADTTGEPEPIPSWLPPAMGIPSLAPPPPSSRPPPPPVEEKPADGPDAAAPSSQQEPVSARHRSDAPKAPPDEKPKPAAIASAAPAQAAAPVRASRRWGYVGTAAGLAVLVACLIAIFASSRRDSSTESGIGKPLGPVSTTSINPFARASRDADGPSPTTSAPAPSDSEPPRSAAGSPASAAATPSGARTVSECAVSYFPPDVFVVPQQLDFVCDDSDGQRGVNRLRQRIVRGSRGALTKGTADWVKLQWYELAVYAIVRQGCCTNASPLVLPNVAGPCESLAKMTDKLAQAVVGHGEVDAAAADFEKTVACVRLQPGKLYRYPGGVGATAREAFRRFIPQPAPR